MWARWKAGSLSSTARNCSMERPQSRSPGLGNELCRRSEIVAAHQRIGIRQSGVGAGVRRILFDRPLKMLYRLLETFDRPLAPEVAALEIEVIGFVGLG